MILYLICILSYFLPLYALRVSRAPVISPLTIMVVFYFMQYGPQALSHSFLKYAADPDPLFDQRFVTALLAANVFLAVGMLLARGVVRGSIASLASRFQVPGLIRTRSMLLVLVLGSFAYAMLFAFADGIDTPRLRENLAFLFSNTDYTYQEIRRQLFADSLVETLMTYTRQTTTALLIALLAVAASRARGMLRVALLVPIIVVFLTAALQLNKFPVFYTILSCAIAIFVFTRRRFHLVKGEYLLAVLAVPGMLFLLYWLYILQYTEELQSGYLTLQNLQDVVLYRPFFAQSDTLRLWFEEFPDQTEFLGIRNVGLLANFLGVDYVDVTRMIPIKYIGMDMTTFQAGFIGSGYASFGYPGIIAYAMVVGIIGFASTVQMVRIRYLDLRAAFCGVMMLNMYFLSSRELSTALLSGGVLPVMLIGWFFGRMGHGRAPRLIPRIRFRTSPGHA